MVPKSNQLSEPQKSWGNNQ